MDIMVIQEVNHLLVCPVLQDIGPGIGIQFGQRVHHVKGERCGMCQQGLVARDMDREVGILAGSGEVKVILLCLCAESFQFHVHAACCPSTQHRQGSNGYLQQNIEFLTRGGRIGDYHLAAVDRVNQEFPGKYLVSGWFFNRLVPFSLPY
jgi:hypothetical protein